LTYRNGKDVLPPDLLAGIQNYINGELLYIPRSNIKRAAWGQLSGSKDLTANRNAKILLMYQNGSTVDDLADEFCLSESSIRKIIHKKK